jgi:hypothetical protein
VCVGAGQRSAQPFAQSRFEVRQLHAAIVFRFRCDRAERRRLVVAAIALT